MVLVERGREPLKGYWSLPGGLVETGERLDAAVVREVFEETGLRVRPSSRFEIFERIMRDASGRAEYHYVLVDYVCRVVKGTLRAGDDVSRVRWVKRGDLGQYRLTEGTLAVIERALNARRKRSRI
jgi:8-oxo-dGTP diphosphatase